MYHRTYPSEQPWEVINLYDPHLPEAACQQPLMVEPYPVNQCNRHPPPPPPPPIGILSTYFLENPREFPGSPDRLSRDGNLPGGC